ncbi:MAG: hypothetical protein JSS32_09895 [Verrucomicrobia bacterium]|nr:hypothetical protein [Verrucomicrobiota bacterium]
MSAGAKSVYSSHLQEGLTLYSQFMKPLAAKRDEMGAQRSTWKTTRVNLEQKVTRNTPDLKQTALQTYHTLVKSQQLAANLLAKLQEIYNRCNRPSIPEHVFETLGGLNTNETVESQIKEVEAVRKTDALIGNFINKVQVSLITPMKTNMEKARQDLDDFMLVMNGKGLPYSATKLYNKQTDSAPELDAEYAAWKTKQTDEEEKEPVKSGAPLPAYLTVAPAAAPSAVPSALVAVEDSDLKDLAPYLTTLGIHFKDPETGIEYGFKPAAMPDADDDADVGGATSSASSTSAGATAFSSSSAVTIANADDSSDAAATATSSDSSGVVVTAVDHSGDAAATTHVDAAAGTFSTDVAENEEAPVELAVGDDVVEVANSGSSTAASMNSSVSASSVSSAASATASVASASTPAPAAKSKQTPSKNTPSMSSSAAATASSASSSAPASSSTASSSGPTRRVVFKPAPPSGPHPSAQSTGGSTSTEKKSQ